MEGLLSELFEVRACVDPWHYDSKRCSTRLYPQSYDAGDFWMCRAVALFVYFGFPSCT